MVKPREHLTFEELGTSHREREYYFPCRAIAMKGNLTLLEGASVVRDMGTHTIGFPVVQLTDDFSSNPLS